MNRVLPGLKPGDPTDPRWACMDCRASTWDEYFVVNHDLWHLAVGSRGGFLCVTCLEVRLGRRLEPADFLACPANDLEWRKTARLVERMTL